MDYVIIDDEKAARKELAYQLKQFQAFTCIGEADNGLDGVRLIEQLQPPLIFLDIQMPGLDGFDVINQSDLAYSPHVVFVTAFDQYAVKAFEVNALDYLLKPVSSDRLQITISKIERQTQEDTKRIAATIKTLSKTHQTPLKRLPVRDGHLIRLLDLDEVVWLEFENPFVFVVNSEQRFETHFDSLKDLEKRLDDKEFFRINRTQLININNIGNIIQFSSKQLHLQMKDKIKTKLSVSREQSRKLKKALGLKT